MQQKVAYDALPNPENFSNPDDLEKMTNQFLIEECKNRKIKGISYFIFKGLFKYLFL